MAVYTATGNTLNLSEHHLYGSSRAGVWNRAINMGVVANPDVSIFARGRKFFELSNHLGNVLVTITDRKQQVPRNDSTVWYYMADVATANDYYPGGMQMPGRTLNSDAYRYGFNGKENDKDISSLTLYDYGFRIYNPSIGKFLSVDPLTENYPWYSPYHFAGNKPIAFVDMDGREDKWYIIELWLDNTNTKIEYTTVDDIGTTQNNNDPPKEKPQGPLGPGVQFHLFIRYWHGTSVRQVEHGTYFVPPAKSKW